MQIARLMPRIEAFILSLLMLFSALGGNPSALAANDENPYIVKPLSDITVAGKSLSSGYAIVTPDANEGTVYGDAAAVLRRGIYNASGIRLIVTEKLLERAIIIKKASDDYPVNEFLLTESDGNIIITGGSDAGTARGITAFINDVLLKAEGSFAVEAGYEFKKVYTNYVKYEDFGAVGDGKTDDIDAIIAAHDYANANGFKVLAREGANYCIGGKNKGAVIKTETDWSTARFTIDDRSVENRGSWIFTVSPSKSSVNLTESASSLAKDAANIGFTLEQDSVVLLIDSNVKRYIRYGANQNSGSVQTDVVYAFADGRISENTPLIWDFESVTYAIAYPIDAETLTVSGGIFTTHANQDPSEYTYYNRGILIQRSNTIVDGLTHYIDGEGKTGAPYSGFVAVQYCANVEVRNCIFTGHKTYATIGSAGTKVKMGTYDLNATTAVNVTYKNCTQTNSITDNKFWGIFGSNYCKNLVYDGCMLSRFDAHMGVANATIKNSVLGHHGINLIGSGRALIENCTVKSTNLVYLRSDYGSTWDGDLIIRNCKYYSSSIPAVIIGGSNFGDHDFGYTCYLPRNIEIDGLQIHGIGRAYLFSDINSKYNSTDYAPEYPMVLPEKIAVRNVTGLLTPKTITVSENKFMFADVTIDYT